MSDSRNKSHSTESKQVTHNSALSNKDALIVVNTTRITESIVFIATAKVYVMDCDGNLRVYRAMLDSGSKSNIITKDLARSLNLRSRKL